MQKSAEDIYWYERTTELSKNIVSAKKGNGITSTINAKPVTYY